MRLVPVNDELPHVAVGNHILANLVRLSSRIGQTNVMGRLEDPAGPRQAMLGRMNGLPGSLGGKIADEQADGRRLRTPGIDARQKLP